DCGRCGRVRRRMRDHGLARIGVRRPGNRNLAAVGVRKHAAVARLAARGRIEHGAIEHDAAFADLDHVRGAMVEIRILAEQALGHRHTAMTIGTGSGYPRAAPATPAPAISWSAKIPD